MHVYRFVVITVKEEFEAILFKYDRHVMRMFKSSSFSISISLGQMAAQLLVWDR